MTRKRRTPDRINHDRWLVSYADFITLLFAFFVVLFSSSQVDKRKVGESFRSNAGGVPANGNFSNGQFTRAHGDH